MSEQQVVNNEAEQRFEIWVGENVGYIDYKLGVGSINLTHTEVSPALEGKGISGKVAAAALDYARDNNLSVIPSCPYIATYIKRHPEYQSLVKADA